MGDDVSGASDGALDGAVVMGWYEGPSVGSIDEGMNVGKCTGDNEGESVGL